MSRARLTAHLRAVKHWIMNDVLKHLTTRRSVSAKKLAEPCPSNEEIQQILEIGCRTPDHGKMAPYYFLIFKASARTDIGKHLRKAYEDENPDTPEAKLDLEAQRFERAPLIIAVISRIREGKHPQWEQILTAGAVCMNICHATHALGYTANWLTEWYAYSDTFREALGLENERDNVAGFIYIGTSTTEKDERERPDLNEIVTEWSDGVNPAKGETYNKDGFGIPRKGFKL